MKLQLPDGANPAKIAIRWNAVIVAIFALIALSMLFKFGLELLQSPDKSEAHWGAVMAIIGFIGGFMTGAWTTAHMRMDETKPQMPVEDHIRLVEMTTRMRPQAPEAVAWDEEHGPDLKAMLEKNRGALDGLQRIVDKGLKRG